MVVATQRVLIFSSVAEGAACGYRLLVASCRLLIVDYWKLLVAACKDIVFLLCLQ